MRVPWDAITIQVDLFLRASGFPLSRKRVGRSLEVLGRFFATISLQRDWLVRASNRPPEATRSRCLAQGGAFEWQKAERLQTDHVASAQTPVTRRNEHDCRDECCRDACLRFLHGRENGSVRARGALKAGFFPFRRHQSFKRLYYFQIKSFSSTFFASFVTKQNVCPFLNPINNLTSHLDNILEGSMILAFYISTNIYFGL
jgi:hypothetical protein